MTANDDRAKLFKYAGLSEVVAISVGFLYFTGYYINSIFIRNLGISRSELFKLEYIGIGLAFALATVGFTIVPASIVYFTYQVRRRSGLPHLHAGAIGNSLNTIVCMTFALFLALFVTRYEWDSDLAPILRISEFSSVAMTALILSAFGMAVLPYIERLVNQLDQKKRRLLFYLLVEPIRFAIFGVCAILIIGLASQVPWFLPLITKGFYFLLAGAILVGGIVGSALWIHSIRNFSTKWLIYCLIGFGVTSLYYMAVTSYVFGVYNYIPYNRGGRLPLTQAFIKLADDKKTIFAPEISVNEITYQGPLYVIEENEDAIFVVGREIDKWFDEFVPVHVIRKDAISYMRLERIENGFPRSNRQNLGQ